MHLDQVEVKLKKKWMRKWIMHLKLKNNNQEMVNEEGNQTKKGPGIVSE